MSRETSLGRLHFTLADFDVQVVASASFKHPQDGPDPAASDADLLESLRLFSAWVSPGRQLRFEFRVSIGKHPLGQLNCKGSSPRQLRVLTSAIANAEVSPVALKGKSSSDRTALEAAEPPIACGVLRSQLRTPRFDRIRSAPHHRERLRETSRPPTCRRCPIYRCPTATRSSCVWSRVCHNHG